MMVKASVMGAVIKMQLSKITPPSSVEAEIFRIGNKDETIDGLNIGDVVFIELRDMKYREKNWGAILFSSATYVTLPLFEILDFNYIFNCHYL